MKYIVSYLLLLASTALSAITTPVFGATYYVDTIGTDSALFGCKKATPCATIKYAVDNGGPNARIIVAPGTYSESPITILEDGVKIQSTAGALSTIIAFGNATIISVSGDKFALGAKAKGFTLRSMGTSLTTRAVVLDGEKTRSKEIVLKAT